MRDTMPFQREVARVIGCPEGWVVPQHYDRERGLVIVCEIVPEAKPPMGVKYMIEIANTAMVAFGAQGAIARACARVRGELELDGHLHSVRCDKDEAVAITSALAATRAAGRYSIDRKSVV